MSDFLKQMSTLSAERAAGVGDLTDGCFDKPLVPLAPDAFDIIAEIKDRSPAEGELAPVSDSRVARAKEYVRGGAAAISVLTEPSRFAGDIGHLEEVAAAVRDVPVMRKDFLVDPVQVLEARAAGASGVLLIVAMLNDEVLRSMLDCAAEHGMFVLLEAFDRDDLQRIRQALTADDEQRAANRQLLFGINTRNLRTLAVDSNRLRELAPDLPDGICVAESGLRTAVDVATIARCGYSMALVGTALMRSDDPAGLIAAMKEAGKVGVAA